MKELHKVQLSTGERRQWQGDVNDLAPDLRDFFPKRPPPAPDPNPLPWVDERELRLAPGRLDEVFSPTPNLDEQKRRAQAMTRQQWSVATIATRLGVSRRTIFRWRLAHKAPYLFPERGGS